MWARSTEGSDTKVKVSGMSWKACRADLAKSLAVGANTYYIGLPRYVYIGPISAMKSFRTRSCILCMKERWFIFKHRKSNIQSVLNMNLEVHKGCKHKTKFHRFIRESGTAAADP